MRVALEPEQIGSFRYVQSLLGKELANLPHWEGNPETEVHMLCHLHLCLNVGDSNLTSWL